MARNHTLDNAKFILIVAVIFGHSIEPYISNSTTLRVVYLFIYSFHMPAFAIISGMLSKAVLNDTSIRKLTKSLFIPFLTFSLLYESLHLLRHGEFSKYLVSLEPYWILWFLLSLFIWRLLLPFTLKLKYPVVWLTIFAVLAGYVDSIDRFLGISRTIYFFPFFVFGYQMTSNRLSDVLYKKLSRAFAVFVLAINAALFSYSPEISTLWLYGASSYSEMGHPEWSAGLIRLIFLFFSLLSAIAVLLLVPRWKTIFSENGKRSFSVFLWHLLCIELLAAASILDYIILLNQWVALLAFSALSLALAYLLSLIAVADYTQRYILGPATRLFIRS